MLKSLLIRLDALFGLNLGLHTVDSVVGIDFKRDLFAVRGLNVNVHAAAKLQSRAILNSILRKGRITR